MNRPLTDDEKSYLESIRKFSELASSAAAEIRCPKCGRAYPEWIRVCAACDIFPDSKTNQQRTV